MPSNLTPKISVIIPSYNYGRYLPDCLESVFAQAYPNIEIIVVDDGSTDDTEQKVQKHLNKIEYFKIENGGVVRARNLGFSKSTGDYICFLDADDQIHPDFLNVLTKPLLEHAGEYQLSYCDAQCIGLKDSRFIGKKWNIYQLLFENFVVPCAVMTRDAFESVGGYSEYMSGKYGFEDWDLWIKFAGRGYRGVYTPGDYHLYRIHGAGRNKEGERNRKQQLKLLRNYNWVLYGRWDVKIAVLLQRISIHLRSQW